MNLVAWEDIKMISKFLKWWKQDSMQEQRWKDYLITPKENEWIKLKGGEIFSSNDTVMFKYNKHGCVSHYFKINSSK